MSLIKVKPDDVVPFSPPGHKNTFNRLLIGPGNGSQNIEVVLGEMKPGGSAELHSHSGNEQAIFMLEGTLLFQTGKGQYILCPGELMFIPQNARHAVECVGGTARFLIVYSPPLSSGEKEVRL